MFSKTEDFGSKSISLIFLIIFAAASGTAVFGAGTVDTTFNASAQYSINGNVFSSFRQPDGKILIGGTFSAVNGVAGSNIARLNVDGTIDSSFNPPDFYNVSGNPVEILAIAVQSNGKILVGGRFEGTSGTAAVAPCLRRLNADGSPDTSFPALAFDSGNSNIVLDINVLPDDRFYVGGSFSYQSLGSFIRFNADGSIDTSFASGFVNTVRKILIMPDGKILIGGGNPSNGQGFLLRYNTNGTNDATFALVNPNGGISAMKQQTDGKIVIGGAFTTVNGTQYAGIARINADGTLDAPFNQFSTNTNGSVSEIEIKSDGKILAGGNFTVFNGISKPKVVQLNPTGFIDNSFTANLGNIGSVNVLKILANGKILTGFSIIQFGNSGGLVVLNPDGTTDISYKYSVGRFFAVNKILQQPDGKILVGGAFDSANNVSRPFLARFNLDGTLDTGFVPVNTQGIVSALALQPDGKILVGVTCCISVYRLNSNGSLDTSFGQGSVTGPAYDITVLQNGQILIGGSFNSGSLLKLNPNGATASSFPSSQPNGIVYKILVQADSKILIGGGFTQTGAFIRRGIARINANETVDTTFSPVEGATGTVYDFDVQTDGKIVLAGSFQSLNGSAAQKNIGRLNSDGSLDPTFAQTTDGILYAVKIQPDGKILAGGSMAYIGGGAATKPGMARFNSNGTLDNSFTANTNSTVNDIVLQADGKILIGGAFTKVNGISKVSIARILNNKNTLFDYDGDGRADISVFRPSTNRWYLFLSSNNTVSEQSFGIAGDTPTPADFDGDGKTDIAIFRPSNGNWWYLSSVDGGQKNFQWGANGDIPRPSDFDGDGKSDFVIFRPAENNWYRFSTSTGVSIVNFGLAGDKPVSGDFDGDGKADVAIFRPSTGDWWYQSSINGAQLATRWGISTDIPAPADYDGDGKTDFAVYRPSTGVWYIINSSNGSFTIAPFGLAEDKPVPADYDGDGRADIAVFRPSTGIWYQMRSTSGFAALQFGVSTDIPTPNAFVP